MQFVTATLEMRNKQPLIVTIYQFGIYLKKASSYIYIYIYNSYFDCLKEAKDSILPSKVKSRRHFFE